MAGAEEYKKTEMKRQTTKFASLSTTMGNQSNDPTIKGMTPPLAPPFKSAAQAQAKAAAQAQAAADALQAQAKTALLMESSKAKAAPANAKIAQPNANETMVKAHERKLKQHTKVWVKADAAVDTDTFIQATTKAFGAHTTPKLIMNAIADLTCKLHKLMFCYF
jgi:hypothetical protein